MVPVSYTHLRGLFFALLLFVGIPLPGTGAWTGTLAASMLDMDFKSSVIAVMLGVIPVSYTHLDVYKRQVIYYNRTFLAIFFTIKHYNKRKSLAESTRPVSYTHLPVSKNFSQISADSIFILHFSK